MDGLGRRDVWIEETPLRRGERRERERESEGETHRGLCN